MSARSVACDVVDFMSQSQLSMTKLFISRLAVYTQRLIDLTRAELEFRFTHASEVLFCPMRTVDCEPDGFPNRKPRALLTMNSFIIAIRRGTSRIPLITPLTKRNFSTHSLIGPDYIVRSRVPDLQPITGVTVPEFVWSNLSCKEKLAAFECSATGTRLTHGDVYRNSRSFAAALIQAGLKHKDGVAIAIGNSPHFPAIMLGIMHAGGMCSTANPGYTPDEMERQILISKPKMVVTIPSFLPTIRRAQTKCPDLKTVIILGEPQAGCHTYSEMIKVSPSAAGVESKFLKGSTIDTEQTVALMPFSSGTTGVPKGVELTHCNLVTNIVQYTWPDYAQINKVYEGDEAERMIGVLPFFHLFALFAVLLVGHHHGAHALTIPKFHPEEFVEMLTRFRPTLLTVVPPILGFLANAPNVDSRHFESVRCIQVGAAPMGLALTNKILEKAGKYLCFQELYGLTETSPAAFVMNPSTRNEKLGSCGTLVPGTLARVVGVDTGTNLGPNNRGELWLKGPHIMKGYFENPEATRNCIDADGWFKTGDIAIYDEEGYFCIVDRLKELIKVKGLQVAPAELEDILRKCSDVADVAVIGVPDERAGELPRAYIVRKTDAALTEKGVHSFLDGKVSKHKELKGGIEFVDVIPKSPSGKILRRELKRIYLEKHTKR